MNEFVEILRPTYILYLLTFLIFPFLGLSIAKHLDTDQSSKYLYWGILLFAMHNILFCIGLSIRGDYADYFIFSFEYLFLSLIVSLLYKSANIYAKITRIIGTIVLSAGFLQGLIGILMFIVVSQEFETDKIYNFSSNRKNYQTRRYCFGFVTLMNIKYSFDTYRKYDYLPLEKLINETDLFDLKSDLDFRDNNFNVDIKDSLNKQILEFSSTNGKKYNTIID